MSDLTTIQSTQAIEIIGSDSTGLETNPVGATVNGLKVDGSAVTQPVSGTITISSGSIDALDQDSIIATYSSAVFLYTPPALAQDIFVIKGSNTKGIFIKKIGISANQTSTGSITINLIKRSTANSGGTTIALPIVSHDNTNATSTASVSTYSTAATTYGTFVGTVRSERLFVSSSNVYNDDLIWTFGEKTSQPIILRGSGDSLCVNLNGVTVNGGNFSIFVEYSEY